MFLINAFLRKKGAKQRMFQKEKKYNHVRYLDRLEAALLLRFNMLLLWTW